VGKNKRISKGKKGGKRKVVDPFTKKSWYDIKAPACFAARNVGWTLVSRTTGAKVATDGLKGRVIAVSLADLNKDEDQAYRIMKLRIEDVQGKHCLTNFHGMNFTTDKLKSLVRKWQSLIEAHVDVKTTDHYVLRIFAIAFTRKEKNSFRKTFYAQTSQIRQIRKKMIQIMTTEATTCDLKDLVNKFIPNAIGKNIEKQCYGIYPLTNVFIRKVKVLRTPKFDPYKLIEIHGDLSEDTGARVERPPEPTAE